MCRQCLTEGINFFRKWKKLSEFSDLFGIAILLSVHVFRMLHPCVYLYIPTDSTGKPNLFLLAALFALSRIGGQKGSSLGMIDDHGSCLSNMKIYAVQVLCNKLHERKQWISAFQFLTSISQPTFQHTLQLAFQHLKTTAQCYH